MAGKKKFKDMTHDDIRKQKLKKDVEFYSPFMKDPATEQFFLNNSHMPQEPQGSERVTKKKKSKGQKPEGARRY